MEKGSRVRSQEDFSGSVFWLSAFYFVYCARPEDWIPGLHHAPLAKIAGASAALSLLLTVGKSPRGFKDLPRESFLSARSDHRPVRFCGVFTGLARRRFFSAFDFSKVYIAWILTFVLITTLARLRRVIFIQAVSVAAVSLVAIVKGHSVPRLVGVIGGIYSNPNDFAFAIALSLPFCLAFLVSATDLLRKALWLLGILVMTIALFLTASRAGFIDLAFSGAVCLWHIGIKGSRMYLIAGTVIVGVLLLITAGGRLQERFAAISDEGQDLTAYESFEQRRLLITKALDAVGDYPLLGLGAWNFVTYSDTWKEVHVSYLQIAVEGGVGSLILYVLFTYCSSPVVLPISCSSVARNQVTKLVSLLEPCIAL